MLLRVEDLDGPRVKKGSAEEMLEELAWLGLKWEGPAVRQSQRREAYRAALERLAAAGWAYPCTCSRKDARNASSAPHAEDGAGVYPGTCRPRGGNVAGAAGEGTCAAEAGEGRTCAAEAGEGRTCAAEAGEGRTCVAEAGEGRICAAEAGRPQGRAAWRVRVPEGAISFADRFAGEQTFDLARTCGDFVIFKNDGLAAYQLAVVVDDCAAGVTAVVRGDDLLESAARQIHLRRLLGLGPEVEYWHLPLVVGSDGRRLAKRHGDTRLGRYRRAGATRERVLGLLGYWSGLLDTRREASMAELLARFEIERVPKARVVFTREDDEFLAAAARRAGEMGGNDKHR
jgi:glutamyl-tRNA synthetase